MSGIVTFLLATLSIVAVFLYLKCNSAKINQYLKNIYNVYQYVMYNKTSKKSIEFGQEIATIHFEHLSREYTIILPYKQWSSPREIYIVKDGIRTQISHMSGIPLMVTAKDMGVDAIIVRDVYQDEEKTFKDNESITIA